MYHPVLPTHPPTFGSEVPARWMINLASLNPQPGFPVAKTAAIACSNIPINCNFVWVSNTRSNVFQLLATYWRFAIGRGLIWWLRLVYNASRPAKKDADVDVKGLEETYVQRRYVCITLYWAAAMPIIVNITPIIADLQQICYSLCTYLR